MSIDHLPDLADPEEIRRFRTALADFRAGRLDEDRFTAIRLQHGVYGQRQAGVFMVRVKIPGGRLSAPRLRAIARALRHESQVNIASVTTRQDIQLHFVPLERVPAVMETLAEVGLTTREACGNTVRNFTACPLAGVCPHQHTDVQTHLAAAARHLLRHPLTQHLPRKVKISLSACEGDCAQARMHDIGVVATWRDGVPGFRVFAGGGLGHKPHEAIEVEPFVPEARLLPVLEALIALHHRHSDRSKRARSRIKFLVDRFGPDGFRDRYRSELARLLPAYAEEPPVRGQWRHGAPEPGDYRRAPRRPLRQADGDRWALPIALPLGDIDADALDGLAALMERYGLREARTTQDQNLVLLDVPEAQREAVAQALAALGLHAPRPGDDVVACPGTWTCRLGITDARAVARVLDGGEDDLRIRVSGCHNGCAQPHLGDIGLHGEGRRLHGRLVPHYRIHLGGDGRAEGPGFAVRGPEVPAARIDQAVARLRAAYRERRHAHEPFAAWVRREGEAYFRNLLADLAHVGPEDLDEVLRDHGAKETFRVLQLGGGECAGIAQETVAAAFAEARFEQGYRDTFRRKGEADAVRDGTLAVLRLGAQGLLAALGERVADDADPQDLAERLRAHAPTEALGIELQGLVSALHAAGDDWSRLDPQTAAADAWLTRAQTQAQRIDRQLHLDAVAALAGEGEEEPVEDLSGETCPMHFVKARMALRRLAPGERMGLRLADLEAVRVVGQSLASLGYRPEETSEENGHPILWVRRPLATETSAKEA